MTDGGSDHIEFLGSFEALDDTRQQAKVLYPLPEILLLCLCAVLGGADSWVEVALYGQRKLGFLRRLLPFAHGVPSHDQLGNVFARLDAQQFQSCFIAWVERFTVAVRGVVAVDGKTLRRSFDRAAKQGPIHMISAWSSQQRLVLGQCKVANNRVSSQPEMPNRAKQCCQDAPGADDRVAPETGAARSAARAAGRGQSKRSSVTMLEEPMILVSLAAACRMER